mmetsp:Transcript_92884/g.200819  ORF Transcript_92884/g.200819 Transcript_92884/m.200819 type:complete len:399 (+) Transcript_92884:64-1260(+)
MFVVTSFTDVTNGNSPFHALADRLGKVCESHGCRRRAAAAVAASPAEKADRDTREAEDRPVEDLIREARQAKYDPPKAAEEPSPPPDLPRPSRPEWKKEIERLRQLVDSPETPDAERIRLLHEALAQRIEDCKGLDEHFCLIDHRCQDLSQERTRCRIEIQKASSSKAKLEDDCRGLEQKKTSIPEETERQLREEEARLEDLESKMEAAMKDTQKKMDAEKEIQEHFTKENQDLKEKMDKFTETCDAQERQLAEKCDLRSSELRTAVDKLSEYETQIVKSKATSVVLEKKNKELTKAIPGLQAELQALLGKFNDSQDEVSTYNEQHRECKTAHEEVQNQLSELEAENAELRNSERLADVTKEQEATKKQCDTLHGLCTNLQKEVDGLRKQLNRAKARR